MRKRRLGWERKSKGRRWANSRVEGEERRREAGGRR